MFEKVLGNRPINPMHVKRLAESIKENGFLCNPVIVNESFEIIDGQHRIEAAKLAQSHVYYIVLNGYGLEEVHTLNLNQKNWTKVSYMHGFADMGLHSYIVLRDFFNKYPFNIGSCISLLSNLSADGQFAYGHKAYSNNVKKQVFEEGTWKVKNVEKAHLYADKIMKLKDYFEAYNKTAFVSAMIQAIDVEEFVFTRFFDKVRKYGHKFLNPTSTTTEFKNQIEELYNYKSRDKVSLKYKYGK